MDLQRRLEALIAPTLVSMGYDLVRVMLQGQNRLTLQVMAEPLDGRAMGVEDCAAVSRALSALLDVEDPIQGAYVLEVSSPGIDRPLTRPKDFSRWSGFDARVETDRPMDDGRKRFKGRLLGLDTEVLVALSTDAGEVHLPLEAVKSAKLVLTDDLIAAVAREAGGGRTRDEDAAPEDSARDGGADSPNA